MCFLHFFLLPLCFQVEYTMHHHHHHHHHTILYSQWTLAIPNLLFLLNFLNKLPIVLIANARTFKSWINGGFRTRMLFRQVKSIFFIILYFALLSLQVRCQSKRHSSGPLRSPSFSFLKRRRFRQGFSLFPFRTFIQLALQFWNLNPINKCLV